MKKKSNCAWKIPRWFVVGLLLSHAWAAAATVEKSLDAPHNMRIIIKMIGPVTQITDLQVICVLKHNPAGDQYIEAMKTLNDTLGGFLSALRDRGQFIGESGETFLFTPPANSITPARVLLIGVGDESKLTLDSLRLAGRVTVREAVRLNVAHVSFAPMLRDQGSSRIDVGEGGAAVVEQFLLAYDTEKRLQAEGLSPKDGLKDLTIEAGQKFFDKVSEKVTTAIAASAAQIKERGTTPYRAVGSGK
jgi:hypothetical protein